MATMQYQTKSVFDESIDLGCFLAEKLKSFVYKYHYILGYF